MANPPQTNTLPLFFARSVTKTPHSPMTEYHYICSSCANAKYTLGTPAIERVCDRCGELKRCAHVSQFNLNSQLQPIPPFCND